MKNLTLLMVTLSLLSVNSYADYMSRFIQWGIASEHPSENRSAIKFIETGVSGEYGRMAYTLGLGGWSDSSGYKVKAENWTSPEVSNSAFVEMLMGVEPYADRFYMTYKAGPAIITNTDCLLGSNIQVAHEFGLGMKDLRGVKVGLVLKHFSNAGIVKPNVGRDFIGLRVEF